MTAKTLTISMSEEDHRFLMEDRLLSPSKIFQAAIVHIKEQRQIVSVELKGLQNQNKFLQKKLWEANDKLEAIQNGNKKID